MHSNDLLSDLPVSLPDELVDVLFECRNVRIERIVSTGHRSADDFWYDQDEFEWVLVLQGEAELQFQDQCAPVVLRPGVCIGIDPHRKHRVQWTSTQIPTVWLAVFVTTD